MCVTEEWPGDPAVPYPNLSMTAKAIEYIRSENEFITVAPVERIALATPHGRTPVYVSTVQAWVKALREARLMQYSNLEEAV